jgi:hypothetical protein
MAKKTTASKRTKEEIYTLAIKKAGGAYKFWRRVAESGGAVDFLLQREGGNFLEKAVSRKSIVGFWIGGKKAWHESENPMGKGIIGGKLLIVRDAKGTSVNADFLK